MKEAYKRIEKIAPKDVASPELLALKASEELGELAAALFHDLGYKKTNKTKKEIKENILEEGVDNLVCVLGVLQKKGFEYKDIVKKLHKKLDKWEKIVDTRKINT